MIRRHAWLLNRPMVNILSRTNLIKGRVLDIGTGPGWIAVELALRHPQWEIWAVDLSRDMLSHARRAAQRAGVSERIHFIHGEASSLPFETGMFDLVYSHFVLHHLAHPEAMFNEAARTTRGGGRIVIKDLLRQPAWKARLLLAFSRFALRYSFGQLRMYRESIDAGLTFQEIRAALKNSQLSMAQIRSFRGLDFVITA
jgi:ubiquinone/menaquinone biosynthesis C-methylase UbiE